MLPLPPCPLCGTVAAITVLKISVSVGVCTASQVSTALSSGQPTRSEHHVNH